MKLYFTFLIINNAEALCTLFEWLLGVKRESFMD